MATAESADLSSGLMLQYNDFFFFFFFAKKYLIMLINNINYASIC